MARTPLLPLLALLLAARADWVEIAQQHYQKPIKLHAPIQDNPNRNVFAQDAPVKTPRNPYLNDKPAMEDVIAKPRNPFLNQNVARTPTRESVNHSIPERGWNQDTRRLGNRRDPGATEPTHKLNFDRNVVPERKQTDIDKNSGTDFKFIDKNDSLLGKIERVPNVGSVKRVKLTNTPVKSPALNTSVFAKNPYRRDDFLKHGSAADGNFSDELDIKTDIFQKSQENTSLKTSSNFEYVFSTEKNPKAHGKVYFNDNTKLTIPFHRFTSKPDIMISDNIDFDTVKPSRGDTKYKQDHTPVTKDTNEDEGMNNIVTSRRPVKHQESLNKENWPKVVHKKENIPKDEIPIKETTENIPVGDVISNNKNNRHSFKEHKDDENQSSAEKKDKFNSSSSEIKVTTIENMLKFMKVVADTISKNCRSGPNGKIAYLNELKHTLLANIQERIEAAWPEEGTPGLRRRRAAEPRGHVEFPSSESALMTISFLTFAVFLIKLVLQVIQTYKHKSMVMAPLMVATAGRAAARHRTR